MTTISIGGSTVDTEDPCALYDALYNARLRMISGGFVEEVMIADLATTRRTRFSVGNMKALDAELARLKDLCAQATGGRKARFAIRAGFRRLPS